MVSLNPLPSEFLSHDSIIKSLQDRNAKLKDEINKVQQTLTNQASISKHILPRQNLITTPTQDVMIKQLQNAHKLIKVYQNQLKNTDKTNIGSVFQRIQSLQKVNISKTEQIKDLKKKLYSISKSIDGNSRKLTTIMPTIDDSQFKLSKLHQQASSLKYFVQQALAKYNQSQISSNKQLQRIKQLQKNLVQLGVSQKQLHDIKVKCSRRQNSQPRLKFIDVKQQVIEDRTIDRFNQFKNQLKVLGKLHASYQKQIELLNKDSMQIRGKTEKGQRQIQEIQGRVESLQEQINKMRQHIKPEDKKTRSIRRLKRY